MVDYTRCNTDALLKMFDETRDDYYEIISKPSNMDWGCISNRSKPVSKYDMILERLRAIRSELISRGEA